MEILTPANAEEFKQASLDLLAGQLATRGAYPGYAAHRLYLPDGPATTVDGYAVLPLGYDAVPGSQRPSLQQQQQQFQAAGLEIDWPQGRPLHPWFDDMVRRQDIGVLTGKGAYWNWGPNYTADPIVFRRTDSGIDVLLIQRGDTKTWALPGGFVDDGEPALDAAIREASEETGLDISDVADQATLVYEGPLADLRITAHAWPETTGLLFDATDIDSPPPRGQDDAINAAWVPTDVCGDILFGSHSLLVGMAGALYNAQS